MKLMYPLLYLGERDEKAVEIPRKVVFQAGPEQPKPYALVTEAEAEVITRRSPNLFAFPSDLEERVKSLYAVKAKPIKAEKPIKPVKVEAEEVQDGD